MKAKTLSSLPSKTDDITPTHLGIGKSEEVRALERNLTEEIILDEHFVLKPTEEGVLPESFPKHPVRMDKRMFRLLFSI